MRRRSLWQTTPHVRVPWSPCVSDITSVRTVSKDADWVLQSCSGTMTACTVQWTLENTVPEIPVVQAHYLHATKTWYHTVFMRPLIWWNQREVGGDRGKTKPKRERERVQYNTEQARQVLNYSLLIYNNKIIWSVKYVPVFSPSGHCTTKSLPSSVSSKKAESWGDRIKNKTIFAPKLAVRSPGECSGVFCFVCLTANLWVYKNMCLFFRATWVRLKLLCMPLKKQTVLPKHI